MRLVEILDDEMAASLVEGDDELLGRCIAGVADRRDSTWRLPLACLNDPPPLYAIRPTHQLSRVPKIAFMTPGVLSFWTGAVNSANSRRLQRA